MTASGRPARPVPTLPSSKRSSGTVCRPRPGTACPSPHLVEASQGPPSAGGALRRSPQEPRRLVACVRPGPARRPALSLTGPHHGPFPVPTPAAPKGPPRRPGHRSAHGAASPSCASWALPEQMRGLVAAPRSCPTLRLAGACPWLPRRGSWVTWLCPMPFRPRAHSCSIPFIGYALPMPVYTLCPSMPVCSHTSKPARSPPRGYALPFGYTLALAVPTLLTYE